ncbi:HAD family phosphatase [bacterium]|nr:MAG: HAD family phosphatase [bacterium]
MKLEAFLWDMDGVLVDTGSAHYQSWVDALSEYGVQLTPEKFWPVFGMNNDLTVRTLLGRSLSRSELDEITHQKETWFRAEMRGNIQLLPGVLTWLHAAKQISIRQAVASSAPIENIDQVLDETGIRPLFDVIVPGYGQPSKPDPWVFQQACDLLGMAGNNCVIVEDSIAGVQAAKQIGAYCLAVTTTNTLKSLREAGADLVVERLDSLDPVTFIAGLKSELP